MTGRTTTVDIDPVEVEIRLMAEAAALREKIDALCDMGRDFHRRGWSLGTSSNYSIVLQRSPMELLLTAHGKDKGALSQTDFVRVDQHGQPCQRQGDPFTSTNQPAAETLLHTTLADRPGVGAVLHTHSVWGTLLSELHAASGGFAIEGYDMLTGLAGIATHETTKWMPIFENTQDVAALAALVADRLTSIEQPLAHGFLIRKHGLYTWGRDLAEARRQIEVFEFLFECEGRRLSFPQSRASPDRPSIEAG